MKTIHKFRIDPDRAVTTLRLKEGFRVARCEYILSDKAVYLWVEQPLHVDVPTVEKHFKVAYSGEPVPDNYRYLHTALDPFGPEAYHLFEVPADEQRQGLAEQTVTRAPAPVDSFSFHPAETA